MDISYIDNLAYNSNGLLHRASPLSKVTMTTLFIATVVISDQPGILAFALALLITGFLITSLPLRVLGFAVYSLFFSLIFAVSEIGGGWTEFMTIVLKSVTAASSVILLVTTTPYPQIFGLLQKILPNSIVDVMLISYRSFFILLKEIQNRITAVKVRGRYKPGAVLQNLTSIGGIIGHGIIHAWELGESMEHAMFVRGYNGRLPVEMKLFRFSAYDVIPVLLGLTALLAAVLA